MEQITSTRHVSVLRREVLEALAVDSGLGGIPLLLDGTLGGAGHSRDLLSANSALFLIGLDQDCAAIRRAHAVLEPFAGRIHLICENFRNVRSALQQLPAEAKKLLEQCGGQFSRMLLDLGISSDQLDEGQRGFSFSQNAPLDMRMNPEQVRTAAEVVNTYALPELRKVFARGGVGQASGPLANAIVNRRPLHTTTELAEVCRSVLMRQRRQKQSSHHPATVPFQAIRIEVNGELEALEEFLETVPDLLAPGGKLAVISFHSLEDKVVANTMRRWSRLKDMPHRFPTAAEGAPLGVLLTKQAIVPGSAEIEINPRARSARMRVFQRNYLQ